MVPRWLRGGPATDVLVGAGLAAAALISVAVARELGALPASLGVVVLCGLVGIRQRFPLFAALAAAALLALGTLTLTSNTVANTAAGNVLLAALALLSYSLGAHAPLGRSLVALTVLCGAIVAVVRPYNPLPLMVTIGPYLGGCLSASRQRAAALLAQQASELAEEREAFARETVRYERARIARELHDIVAHNVSMMVVQAGAGERLAASDPARATQAFASIADAARQADEEIDRLVDLLGREPSGISAGLEVIEELIVRAQRSGLTISCAFEGDLLDLSEATAEAMTRTVQEGITNAVKHAPGAPISIGINGSHEHVELEISNAPPRRSSSGLERAGASHGLVGMRERVLECGGTLDSRATEEGGWRVAVNLPRRLATPGR